MNSDGGTRAYRMDVRARSTAATRERILAATLATFFDAPTLDVPLRTVAERAGVSVQTVLRHFESKDGLVAAAAAYTAGRIGDQRDRAPVGDLTGAVENLVAHYEELGDGVVRMLAEETRNPALSVVADQGRAYHREWCARVFAGGLAHTPEADRPRRLAQVVAVCDVFTWKLLRRDQGLSRDETTRALVELLRPLLQES
ncbi:TetR/AcrR family transcriptional regulator [Mumia sp. DW29H23]|uniref:TetR/AcrR family transcriptional regulator n=1 Tax=Mumia sp. DW29H23 TaxID=3421241 RepID=UPI003D6982E1